jgi:hypothetical protein
MNVDLCIILLQRKKADQPAPSRGGSSIQHARLPRVAGIVVDRRENVDQMGVERRARDDKWDGRAKALDPLSAVNNISRDPSWGKQIERWMNFIDESRMWNIFHLRV